MNVLTLQITNQENNCMGGAYDRYMTLINGFLEEGWYVHHISPRGFSNLKHESLTHYGVRGINITPHFLPFFIQTIPTMLFINKKVNIDFIIVFSPLESLMGVIFKLFNGKTRLITCFRADSVSNLKADHRKGNIALTLTIKFLNLIEKIAVKRSDYVIFLSKKNRDDILKRVNYEKDDKIDVIYNGITPRLSSLTSDYKIVRHSDKNVIGYVGAMYAAKGVSHLIKAFSNVKKVLPDATLVLVGEGLDKERFIELTADLNLEDSVIFTGYQENPFPYIRGFDLMIVPSLSEAFGIVIFEALFVQTPVFGSDKGGIPEVLIYKELLFEVGSPELELKILEFFQNTEAHEKVVKLCNQRKDVFMFDWSRKMINSIKKRLPNVE
ncbi:glycosyltransferase [uncultured Methanobacterium sp.]|uniref:glycosyltransferase n=1 Tax=uncultured Methanobacterium sp. TaxID=176306 RepID=UPI002AA6E821|nr:glycosyltransferase [uncultured Methanobacterium sp.]